jgi:5-carboxymethyl-2-hydroxymuconate isomerase
MPHCVIECPKSLSALVDFSVLVKAVHDVTQASGLFSQGDVKARIVTAEHYVVGGQVQDYVHVISHILSGRTIEQRKTLADAITLALCELLPTVKMLSVEVREIERQIYSNRAAVNIPIPPQDAVSELS